MAFPLKFSVGDHVIIRRSRPDRKPEAGRAYTLWTVVGGQPSDDSKHYRYTVKNARGTINHVRTDDLQLYPEKTSRQRLIVKL